MKRFEPGKTYSTRSLCDYDCVFRYHVVSRSEKSIVIESRGQQTRRKVWVSDDVEACFPEGKYSMCPCIFADNS